MAPQKRRFSNFLLLNDGLNYQEIFEAKFSTVILRNLSHPPILLAGFWLIGEGSNTLDYSSQLSMSPEMRRFWHLPTKPFGLTGDRVEAIAGDSCESPALMSEQEDQTSGHGE